MSDKVAIYPGTFDPITLGHIDIIQRGAALFDQIIIGVATSARKKPLFSQQQRIEFCQQVLASLDNVHVKPLTGLTVDFAQQHQAQFLLRGLRAASDVDYELQIATMNQLMSSELETVFLTASQQYAGVSGSMVREIIACEGWQRLTHFLPECIIQHITP